MTADVKNLWNRKNKTAACSIRKNHQLKRIPAFDKHILNNTITQEQNKSDDRVRPACSLYFGQCC